MRLYLPQGLSDECDQISSSIKNQFGKKILRIDTLKRSDLKKNLFSILLSGSI